MSIHQAMSLHLNMESLCDGLDKQMWWKSHWMLAFWYVRAWSFEPPYKGM